MNGPVVLSTGWSFVLGVQRNSRTALDVGVGVIGKRFANTSSTIIGGGSCAWTVAGGCREGLLWNSV